jgi:SAM-dependent methyltransferase
MALFQEVSYRRHAEGFGTDLTDPGRRKISDSWFDRSTADFWRHARSYAVAGLLGGVPGERWLTVGDGRFGLDAIRLKEQGVGDVLPSDLTEILLKESRERGLISNYSVENAERLSFPNGSFDYVFCKEAYHHFPRPLIALYEMLRVSRKGVILIEPNDRLHSQVRIWRGTLKALLGRGQHMDQNSYEEDGNYVFSISERELEKVAMGINLPQLAFKGLNDHYAPGLEFEAMTSAPAKKMLRHIRVRDMLCRIGLDHPALLMACLFHKSLEPDRRRQMESAGWHIVDLPRNPYHPKEPIADRATIS